MKENVNKIKLNELLESLRFNYSLPSNYRPVIGVDFSKSNSMEKADAFSAIYYIFMKNDVKNDAIAQDFYNVLTDIGIHPIMASVFFKHFFDLQVGKFKYSGNLDYFPQFTPFSNEKSMLMNLKTLSNKNKKLNTLLTHLKTVGNIKFDESISKFNFSAAQKESEFISSKLNKDWSNLRELWLKYYGIPLSDFENEEGHPLTGEYIKKIYQKKILNYNTMTEDLVKNIIRQFPKGIFKDEEELFEAAQEALVKSMRTLMLSPTIWKSAFDKGGSKGKGNLKIGPSFLRGYNLNPLTMDSSKIGGILLRIKAAVFDAMRKSDFITPHFRKKVKLVQDFVNNYINVYDNHPTEETIALKLGMKVENVKEYLRLLNFKDVEFTDTVANSGKITAQVNYGRNSIDWEDPLNLVSLIDMVDKSWKIMSKSLTTQEKVIVSLFVIEELSFKEIAEILQENEEELRVQYGVAMSKCQDLFRAKILKGYSW